MMVGQVGAGNLLAYLVGKTVFVTPPTVESHRPAHCYQTASYYPCLPCRDAGAYSMINLRSIAEHNY
jgi:hypothetical protein